jgi:hypothetical protein
MAAMAAVAGMAAAAMGGMTVAGVAAVGMAGWLAGVSGVIVTGMAATMVAAMAAVTVTGGAMVLTGRTAMALAAAVMGITAVPPSVAAGVLPGVVFVRVLLAVIFARRACVIRVGQVRPPGQAGGEQAGEGRKEEDSFHK